MSTASLDVKKIKQAVQSGIPLSITTYTLPHEMEMYISEILTAFLKELNKADITEYLTYCLSELTTNAKKANTKRVYFKEKGLNIEDPNDYIEGMKKFKSDILENVNYWLNLQKSENYYIKIFFQNNAKYLKIEVRNNSPLVFEEYKRVHDKIVRAQQYTAIDDAFTQILDDTEGAGLGLTILILMLQKMGFSQDNFHVIVQNNETIMRIVLPVSQEIQKGIFDLSKELVNMIETLPRFPENILTISNLLSNPESKLSDIALHISSDMTLTADLLKLVNSAAFSLTTPCKNILDAVKLIGMRGMKNLLYSVGAMQNLGSSTEDQKKLWKHSSQVAFYAYNLSRNFAATTKTVVEDSYVCGLLHDIGKIVFDTAHPKLLKKFEELCNTKRFSPRLFEEFVSGKNHSEIGALIAEKWNLPAVIKNAIRYHHDPFSAPKEYQLIASLTYLANMLTFLTEETVELYQFDSEVLKLFGITSEQQLLLISEKLNSAYQKEMHESIHS